MVMGCLSFPQDVSQHHHLRAQSPRTKRVETGMATFTTTPSVTHWGVLCFLALQPRTQLELPQETVRVSLNYKLQLMPATLASCARGPADNKRHRCPVELADLVIRRWRTPCGQPVTLVGPCWYSCAQF